MKKLKLNYTCTDPDCAQYMAKVTDTRYSYIEYREWFGNYIVCHAVVDLQDYSQMKCPYCESGTNDFVPMNQTAEYSGIEMSVNRQGMLRVRVLDDDGGFTTQDIVEIRSCPLCGKRFVKG